jgi:hypothetical protein
VVSAQVRTRDLQRAQHSRVLLSALSAVVRAAEASGAAQGDSVAAALEGRQQDAVARATTAATGWEAAAAQQEQGLARALEAATECVASYAAAQGGQKGMGTSEAALPDARREAGGRRESLARAALGAYAEWEGQVGADVAARETDAALQARTPSTCDCSIMSAFLGAEETFSWCKDQPLPGLVVASVQRLRGVVTSCAGESPIHQLLT